VTDAFALYEAAVSAVSAVGLLYLLYSGRFAVAYHRFFRALAVGLLAFAVVSVALALHPTTSTAEVLVGPFVLPALYLLVRRQLRESRADTDFEADFGDRQRVGRTDSSGDRPRQ
jgi:Flp pilus assembly protein TadB